MKCDNKKKTTAIVAAIMSAAISFGAQKAAAQMNGSAEGIVTKDKATSYVRLNDFYSLPGKIGGYTFIELYSGKAGYFGKTALTKEIGYGISAKGELLHCNEPFTEAHLGLEAKLAMPKGTTLKVKALPLCIDKDGRIVKDKVILGYFVNVDLAKGLSLSSFGEFNALKGGQWGYGEINLKKYVWDGVSISYNPALISQGKLMPTMSQRVTVEIGF
jgi:hypothetical protein